jgi:hypothetical protein
MRALVITILLLVPLMSTEAYAAQFSFDPSSARPGKHDYTVVILFIATASLVGTILIVAERKKAKGIWFSNAEKLR